MSNALTVFVSSGITRKPEGSSGASSAKDSSIGAKTSCAQAPEAFSSTPLQSCSFKITSQSQDTATIEQPKETVGKIPYLQKVHISRKKHFIMAKPMSFQPKDLKELQIKRI